MHDLKGFLAPAPDQVSALRSRVEAHHARLIGEATSWWSGRQWVLRYREDFPAAADAENPIERNINRFWHRSHWNDNPWIVYITARLSRAPGLHAYRPANYASFTFIVPDIGSLFLQCVGPATSHHAIFTRNCGGGQPQFCLLLRPSALVQG